MTDHPETYALTRAEWLEVNRVLSVAALYASGCLRGRDSQRLALARAAQETLSASYQRSIAALRIR